MKITILGAGNIGATLGKKWLASGHHVAFGVRDVHSPKVQRLRSEIGGGAEIGSIESALALGEAVLFSIPWSAVPQVATAHAESLDGKILIDATNNFAGPVINNLAALRGSAPAGKIYRAFNSLGWELFAEAHIGGFQVDHFYCGADGPARVQVEELIQQVGLRPIWVGGLERVELVDNLGALWLELAIRKGLGRRLAFKLLGA
ncbi:MAG TPA: NAD(P)-binding domain-containing protein [Anaerolineales bacterium]|nr:NAD(P)-binding domain-containing protein [Anaerolineales bacterium]